MRFRVVFGVICAVALAALPSWAHHSHGNYTDTFTDIQGVVKEVHLVVPHSWVYMEVNDEKGQPQIWALEATGRGGLERLGVTSRIHQAGRQDQGAVPRAAGRLARLPARVPEGGRRHGQGLGRRAEHAHSDRLLDPDSPVLVC